MSHASDQQLSMFIDGELSATSRATVAAHLAGCPACAERHERLVDVAASLRILPAVRWTPAATAATIERCQQPPVAAGRVSRGVLAALALAVLAAAALSTTWLSALLSIARSAAATALVVLPLGPAGGAANLWILLATAILAPLAALTLARGHRR